MSVGEICARVRCVNISEKIKLFVDTQIDISFPILLKFQRNIFFRIFILIYF